MTIQTNGICIIRNPSLKIVVYWPTTRPGCQNRKCTYVNNRCIRSRNIRIITLTMDGLSECNCDAHRKKVDIELLYNSLTGNQLIWRPDQLGTRCGKESQHPERLGPQAPGWAAQENGKETRLWPNWVGVNILQFYSVSNSLSHTTLSNKVRGIFF